AVHAGSLAAPPDVAPAHHDGHLDLQLTRDLRELSREPRGRFRRDAVAELGRGERVARELQEDPSVDRRLLSHFSRAPRRARSVRTGGWPPSPPPSTPPRRRAGRSTSNRPSRTADPRGRCPCRTR